MIDSFVLAREDIAQLLRCSVVICTDGRAESLGKTLECLRLIDYPHFEVCVVYGPTLDGTREILEGFLGEIKVAACPEHNLSMARNIGIALASGEIVAFIDDDALAESEWLSDLVEAFRDETVGAAGGVVYDRTGVVVQYLYPSVDRLGRADVIRQSPAEEFNFPFSFNIPHLQGTNSAFRRSTLVTVGGFDEEYEYYLDETDLCARVLDAGFQIRQLPGAVVHHKFLPSSLRNEYDVLRDRYSLVKNKIYFSLINNHGHYGVDQAVRDALRFVDEQEHEIRDNIECGHLQPADLTTFQSDVERAWDTGLRRGLSGNYLEYPRPDDGRRTFIYIIQENPSGRIGDVERLIEKVARSSAELGYQVHLLRCGKAHDRLDFEDGMWVHHLCAQPVEAASSSRLKVPWPIWADSEPIQRRLGNISKRRRVTAVVGPIWDCAGLALLLDSRCPLVTSLQTTLHSWISTNPVLAPKLPIVEELISQIFLLEAKIMTGSDDLSAMSRVILDEIERGYGLQIDRERVAFIPLGLEDWKNLDFDQPSPLPTGALRLLFVGSLKERKGIDVLLGAAKQVLMRHPDVFLDIAGDETIPGPSGDTWRSRFEEDRRADPIRARVQCHGEVTKARLRGLYTACNVVIIPSPFESFGLMLVEGMMFGKPVIGVGADGMVEVVQYGKTGLLAEAGDGLSLEGCLDNLIQDAALRARLGAVARARYEQHFKVERVTKEVVEFLTRIRDSWGAV
jgi:glycogen(starch) synthase